MRILTVTAHGFGPLKGQTLILTPGFTVVAGANESGKSSWHAATLAALGGRRRARGRLAAEEQHFVDAHQPWDGAAWSVSATVELDDGRLIELRQDLAGKVDCRATDVGLARDVSAEIMVDGSPDATAWLGLTRASFRATACVSQAQVLGVLAAADGLQHSLQQSASTAGTSGTAALALELLEGCRRREIGRDSATSTRPLRRALDAVAEAELALAAAWAGSQRFAAAAQESQALSAQAEVLRAHAEAAAKDAQAAQEELQAVERAPFPTPSADPHRPSGRPRPRLSPAAVILVLLLAVLGVVGLFARSVVLTVCGALGAALVAGWFWNARRDGATVVAPAAAQTIERAPPGTSHAHPLLDQPGVAELRMECAERQALAHSARRRHHEAALQASRAEAVFAERAQALPSPTEAEEALACAREEVQRLQELDETMALASKFLSRAQERVHRAVVPELIALLREWLPRLTDGRYVDVRLDPATLAVEVCGVDREFRRAQLLSHGTAEQIYLLLRVALATQLAAGYGSCPLLLDDVTGHADPERTARLLGLLRELSADRQIVLFAQQPQVREWAACQLTGPRDTLVLLEELAPP